MLVVQYPIKVLLQTAPVPLAKLAQTRIDPHFDIVLPGSVLLRLLVVQEQIVNIPVIVVGGECGAAHSAVVIPVVVVGRVDVQGFGRHSDVQLRGRLTLRNLILISPAQ